MAFRAFLEEIGLTPAKSKTLGPLLNFLEWVAGKIEQLFGLQGHLQKKASREAHSLLFIGQKALELGGYVFYADDVLALPRKRYVWQHMQKYNQNLGGIE